LRSRAPGWLLAPITQGPFYAVQVMPGAFGTSGGVRTDDRGRALTGDGR
jgi:3-oxosteroid 1-dehydrogenase